MLVFKGKHQIIVLKFRATLKNLSKMMFFEDICRKWDGRLFIIYLKIPHIYTKPQFLKAFYFKLRKQK